MQWHRKSRRKPSGGILKEHKKKKKYERGRDFLPARIGKRKAEKIRTRGGNEKLVILLENYANVATKNGVKKVKILDVIENKAHPLFTRRNIITKGAVIKTEIGNAIVTSRPGQHGVINAKLIEK